MNSLQTDFDISVFVFFFLLLQVSFLAVDDLYEVDIPLEPDPHKDVVIMDVPYTNASIKKKGKAWQGSASKVR